MSTKKQRMMGRIYSHGVDLHHIFPESQGRAAVPLCKALRRIETRLTRLSERECNEGLKEGEWERAEARALDRLDDLLGWREAGVPIFINGDPRGYALKIDDDYVREHDLDIHRDWGGYGIIAPDLSEE